MMSPALIEPAAAVGATAAHSLLTSFRLPTSAHAAPVATAAGSTASASSSSSGSSSFQSLLSSVQNQGVQGLIGLKTGDLRQVIASMTPQQKLALGQQLMGAKVSVQNGAGQVVQGVASKLQLENGLPVFDVAGQNYSLSSLSSVLNTSAV